MFRRVAVLAVLAGLGALLTSCTPPGQLTVTTTFDGHDASAGDGVCEINAGVGDCSLRAAVEEAGATGSITLVVLPSGVFALSLGPLVVDPQAGSVRLVTSGAGVAIDAGGATAAVQVAGGAVGLDRVALTGAAGDGGRVAAGAPVQVG